jgi:hypothetical protein
MFSVAVAENVGVELKVTTFSDAPVPPPVGGIGAKRIEAVATDTPDPPLPFWTTPINGVVVHGVEPLSWAAA